MTTGSKRRASWRYWLQQIHLWVGLILCIPLVIVGLTGSILVYGHDLEHLFGPPEPSVTVLGEPRPAGEILAAALAWAPPGLVPIMLRMPAEPGPAAVRLTRPGGGRGASGGSPFAGSVQVLVDPVSLRVLADAGSTPGWLRVIHNLHGNLLISGRDGRVAVGWLGIVMLVLGVSGLILWWPRPGRWSAAFKVRKGARGLRLHRDLHGAIGIWSLVVFLVVSFSGIYLVFPQQAAAVINVAFSGRDLRAAATAIRVEPVSGADPIDIDEAIALARGAIGESAFRMAFLPSRPNQPIRISLARPEDAADAPTVTVFIDPWTAKVAEIHDPRLFTVGETVMAWQRALHYGLGLGGVYKFLVFLSGLVIPIFAVTGCAMWLLKRRARRVTVRRKQA